MARIQEDSAYTELPDQDPRGAARQLQQKGYDLVDVDHRHPVRYVDVYFSTLKEAIAERECLLRFFPSDHAWRSRLRIRCPDGTIQ